ncbi:hypothetical protein JCM6882_006513 [Rhodosporidiobolus microsporus]
MAPTARPSKLPPKRKVTSTTWNLARFNAGLDRLEREVKRLGRALKQLNRAVDEGLPARRVGTRSSARLRARKT